MSAGELTVSRLRWDIRFIELARLISTWSKDPSNKVGAVIVDPARRIVSCGYNGFPVGIEDSLELLNDREQKYKRILHAEKNAMLFSRRDVHGCTLYSTLPPCAQCTAAGLQLGIMNFVSVTTDDYNSRWETDIAAAQDMCKQVHANYDIIGVQWPSNISSR